MAFLNPKLWQQFGEDPFPFQHKARSIQNGCAEMGGEEHDWPAQRPNLNPTEPLWPELEHWLWARPDLLHQCPNFCAEMEANPTNNVPTTCGNLPRRVEPIIAAKLREKWREIKRKATSRFRISDRQKWGTRKMTLLPAYSSLAFCSSTATQYLTGWGDDRGVGLSWCPCE